MRFAIETNHIWTKKKKNEQKKYENLISLKHNAFVCWHNSSGFNLYAKRVTMNYFKKVNDGARTKNDNDSGSRLFQLAKITRNLKLSRLIRISR